MGLFGWFQKKPKQLEEVKQVSVFKKRTKKIITEDQEFNVGKTEVILKFKDGRTFTILVMGQPNQDMASYGSDENEKYYVIEPSVNEPYITTSVEIARRHIMDGIRGQEGRYVKDMTDMKELAIGEVISAKIGKTKDYLIKYSIRKVVDI